MSKKQTIAVLLIGILLLGFAYYRQVSRAIDRQINTIFIGDSYVLTSEWPKAAAEETGMKKYQLSAYSGTGFASTVSDDNGEDVNFGILLDRAHDSLSRFEDIRWIVVGGGYNDQHFAEEEVREGIDSFIAKAKEYYPGVNVIIAMNGSHACDEEIQKRLAGVAWVYQSEAEVNGQYYYDGASGLLNNRSECFLEDGFHPNMDAGKEIGKSIGSFLLAKMKETGKTATNESLKGLAVNIGVLIAIFIGAYIAALRKNPKKPKKPDQPKQEDKPKTVVRRIE